ncbi:MAG: Wzz/FepE/Etk N-terminal domain-containing protein [Arcobacter sp.]|uniref:Wzz/FepE/Etk N-terminal domain-containing protein n=1 Tax=Arcobacter sp. TaxID=1872629 RepID=UPI003B008618
MVQNNNLQENEIDLRELFLTIWSHKIFIAYFTIIATFGAIIYTYVKTPIYEVSAIVKIGSIKNSNHLNNNLIENPNNLVERLKLLYSEAGIKSISLIRGTENLIKIDLNASENQNGVDNLKKITSNIIKGHTKEINNYVTLIKQNIKKLQQQKLELENSKNKFDGSMAIKFDLTSKIDNLNLEISSYNIKQTELLGDIITNEYPIKPKKKLIVTVAFVTGFILSIFLVFFIEFIKGIRKEKKIK